jgi:hypothetical protein
LFKSEAFQEALKGFVKNIGDFAAKIFSTAQNIPGYKPYVPPTNGSGSSSTSASTEARNAYNILVAAINKQKDLAAAQLKLIDEILSTTLDAIKQLTNTVDPVKQQQYLDARRFITGAAGDVKNGILPDSIAYKDAIAAAVSGVSDATYASKVDEERAKMLLANELQGIADVLGPQKTGLEQQIAYLDGLLTTAKEQLDAMTNTATAIMSLAQAIANWTTVTGQLLPNAPTFTMPTFTTFSGGSNGLGGAGSGGSASSSVGDVVNELQQLRTEVTLLRAEVRADVTANIKTSKILERVSPDGTSLYTHAV